MLKNSKPGQVNYNANSFTISNPTGFLGDLINTQPITPNHDKINAASQNGLTNDNKDFLNNMLSSHTGYDINKKSKYLLQSRVSLYKPLERYKRKSASNDGSSLLTTAITPSSPPFTSNLAYGGAQFYDNLNNDYHFSSFNNDIDNRNVNPYQKENSSTFLKSSKNRSGRFGYASESKRYDDIRILKDTTSSRITDYFSANAVTVGGNILLGDTFDINTPQGFALLVHELTHMKQQLNDKNLSKTRIISMRRTSLEREALENEKKALQNYSEHFANTSFPHLLNTAYRMIFSSTAGYSSGLTKDYNSGSYAHGDNLFYNSYKKPVQNANDNMDENHYNIIGGNDHKNSKNLSSHSEFHSLDNGNVSNGNMIYSRVIDSSNNSENSFIDKPMNVLLAEKNRSIESISQEKPMETNVASSSKAFANQQTIHFEHIAEKVYEMIEMKIKKQRNRRGIR